MTNELIVRELSAVVLNVAALVPGVGTGTEVNDNVAKFFNDTPFDLNLVAVRIASVLNFTPIQADTAAAVVGFAVAELSRQSEAGQQEGIICNVRGVAGYWGGTNALGGKAGMINTQGELVFGDFKTPMMVLETQTNLFLHSVMSVLQNSITTVAIGAGVHALGATLYFKRKGR